MIYVRKGALVKALQWKVFPDGDNYVEVCGTFPNERFRRANGKLFFYDFPLESGEWIIEVERPSEKTKFVTHMPDNMFRDLYRPLNVKGEITLEGI